MNNFQKELQHIYAAVYKYGWNIQPQTITDPILQDIIERRYKAFHILEQTAHEIKMLYQDHIKESSIES